MSRVETTTFISYRRTTAAGWALAISQNLAQHDFDVFLDFQSIASGDFEQVIVENIKARAHFVILLTPSALERVGEPGDWLRREIETALEYRRNVVPVMLDGFNFGSPSIAKHLIGTLEPLKHYNGLTVAPESFDAAMSRLRNSFLNIPVDAVLHPPSTVAANAAAVQRAAITTALPVTTEQLTAEQWSERGFEATDVEQKIRCFTEAIRAKKDHVIAYNNRGVARMELGDFERAQEDFDESIRLKPNEFVAHNNRGNVLSLKGDINAALAEYDEALRLKSDYHEAYSNRGRLVGLHGGDLERAIADLDEAIRLRPSYVTAYANRAVLRRHQGDRTGMIADLQTFLALGGGIRDGNQKYVEELIRELQADDARKIAALNERDKRRVYAGNGSTTGNVKPQLSASEWFERGVETSVADEEIRCFTEVIRLNPREAEAYFNRGLARKSKGDIDGSLSDFDEALRIMSSMGQVDLAPSMGRVYLARGNAHSQKGDSDSALSDYDRVVRLEPLNPLAFRNRGSVRRTKGDLGGAVADFTEALRLKSDYVEAYIDRGVVRSRVGDLDGAVADYTDAIRIDANNANAYNNRGVVHRKKGDFASALADYDEAIRLRPDAAGAYKNRSLIRRHQGETWNAVVDLMRYLKRTWVP